MDSFFETSANLVNLGLLAESLHRYTEPDTTLLSEKDVNRIHALLTAAWDAVTLVGFTVPINKPSKLEVAARPAYAIVLLLTISAMLLQSGPLPSQCRLSADSLVGTTLVWRLVATVSDAENTPSSATQAEFEMFFGPGGDGVSTGQRFYFPLDNASHQAGNVLTVDPAVTEISFRARYVDAEGRPLGLWSYSNSTLASLLPAT
jgi:hypothetical protein